MDADAEACARRSNAAGFGISGGGDASPWSGASQAPSRASRKSTTAAGRAARICANRSSTQICAICIESQRTLSQPSDRLSSSRQGAGAVPSSRYSQGRTFSDASPSLTPSRYASSNARSSVGQRGDLRLSALAEKVPAVVQIQAQHAGTDQFRQFSSRGPAKQIHLEEPLLGVNKYQCIG